MPKVRTTRDVPESVDVVLGRALARTPVELDPLSVHCSGWLARFLLYASDYDGAIAQGQKTLELDDTSIRAFHWIGAAHLALGDSESALDWFRRGQAIDSAVRSYDAMIVRALALLGRRDEDAEILTRLDEESRRQYVRGEYLAMGHAAVGNLDQAFDALERAYQARSAGLVYLHLDPGYEPLRDDSRYTAIVQRMGLR